MSAMWLTIHEDSAHSQWLRVEMDQRDVNHAPPEMLALALVLMAKNN